MVSLRTNDFRFLFFTFIRNQSIQRHYLQNNFTKNIFYHFFMVNCDSTFSHILNNSLHPLALLPPETYFNLKPGNLVYYFSYFLLGVLLYSNQQIFSKLSENKTITILGILSVLAYFAQVYAGSLLFSEVEDIRYTRYLKFDPILILFSAFVKGINTILWCLFFIGLHPNLFNRVVQSLDGLLNSLPYIYSTPYSTDVYQCWALRYRIEEPNR